METHEIQRVLRARYGGVEASDVLVQFARIELQRPDALVWMQNGKFYEVYGNAARLLGRLLDLRVAEKPLMTGANRQPVMLAMTGITIGSEREHLGRLLRMGYRVAIGREVDGERDGAIKARQLEEVITPGTLFDEDLLGDERQLLAAVDLGHERAGLALADVSTSSLWCQEWAGPDAHDRLMDELARTGPAELLCNGDLPREDRERLGGASGITRLEGERAQRHRALCDELGVINSYHVGRLSPLPGWWFTAELCQEALQAHFQTLDLRPFELADRPYAMRATGVLIRYLRWNRFPAIARLQTVRLGGGSHLLQLDATSRRTLDILTGPDGTPYGSLLAVLDQTRTPMGGRLLKTWLTQGLRDPARLAVRYDAVQACVQDTLAREEIRAQLGRVRDLERVVNRLLIGPDRAAPRDMARLRDALEAAETLAAALAKLGGLGLEAYAPPSEGAALLAQALAAAPRPSLTPRADAEAGALLAAGWDAELDTFLAQEQQILAEVERFVSGLYLTTGIKSLQQKRDGRTGQIVLTISASDARKVPAGWSRVVKGKEQYTTDQLRQLSEALIEVEAQRIDVEQAAWRRLWRRIADQGPRLIQLARDLAHIDVVATLAHVAVRERWTRPQIVADRVLSIVGGRHPVVCRAVDGYIPATVLLDQSARLITLTGPNMSGKSTLMRMVALCVVLAQMGSFVPAEAMTLGLCDRIFTRIGAAEDIASGRSTFLVEMTEVSTIIHQATADSFVVLDEVGRGTATYDGMALAEAIVEHLHNVTRCRGVFATHYHHLVAMIGQLPHVACFQMGVRRDDDRLVFLHTLQPGVAEGSFGIAVARMAGLPAPILARAQARLTALEAEQRQRLPTEEVSLDQLIRQIELLDTRSMLPQEATAAIRELQSLCRALLGAHQIAGAPTCS
ncbi:MAG: DNA mismatch repair protein MutS [Chloroflexales bacterium]|nr:DNA mismatch repair protein MutS [Chloroflexales bacterium]